MDILQVASFSGNIGDDANHNGFRTAMDNRFGSNLYTSVEIRNFYQTWKLRDFNTDEFIDECNQHDLVVFGGGDFFAPSWGNSFTGTTFDISTDTFERITSPMLFNALGVSLAGGSGGAARFQAFLDYALSRPSKFLVTVRNDGSMQNLNRLYDRRYQYLISEVPDPGFFVNVHGTAPGELRPGRRLVGIQLQSNLKHSQFAAGQEITYNEFVATVAAVCIHFLTENPVHDLIVFPHIFSDFEAIQEFMSHFPDHLRRLRLIVAPLVSGMGTEKHLFGLYAHCDSVIAMRFHASVCPVGLGIPTISFKYGTRADNRVASVFESLGLTDCIVDCSKPYFDIDLSNKLSDSFAYQAEFRAKLAAVRCQLDSRFQRYLDEIEHWLNSRSGAIMV